MAELSKDTQAIIATLKEERNNLQNDGRRHSLKNIRADLAKFQGTFDAIREAMTGIQVLNTEQSEYNKLKAERDIELIDLTEKEREEYKKTNADRVKREQKLQVKELERKEKADKEREKKETKIFGKDGILINGIKSAFKFAMLAALASVGYSFVAGFLEGYRPDLFGPEGKYFDLPNTVFDLFDKMTSNLAKVDWAGLAKNLNTLSDPNFLSNIGLVAGGAGALALAGQIPVGEIPGPAGTAKTALLKTGIAATLFGAVNLAWPKVEQYIYGELNGMSADEIAALDGQTTLLDATKYGIQGAMTMAVMFGSKAGLWGAVAGFALGIGMMAIEYMNEKRTQVEQDFLYDYTNNLDLVTRAMKGDDMTEQDVDKLVEMHEEGMAVLSRTQNEQTAKLIRANLANINKALIENVGPERFESLLNFGRSDFSDSTLKEIENVAIQRALDGDGSGLDDLLKLYQAMRPNWDKEKVAEFAQRRLAGIGSDNLGRLGDVFNIDGQFGDGVADVPLAIQKYEKAKFVDLLNASISNMRTGSYGFKDFGRGTLAMLHGEEAVITRNSLEGQILEGLRSGSTISGMTEKIAMAMESGTGSSTVVVNNVNNASNPISVQTSMGGARVAHTKIGGGGMGGSYIDMPGLIG